MDEKRLKEISDRVNAATSDLVEEEHGWIISESLSPSGCCVYSPHAGIVYESDYQLFLHAKKDILDLLAHIRKS